MRKWQDFVTLTQLEWVEDQLKGFDIVMASLHGSMLYGLERKGSDVDIKAVYIPTFKDLLMGDSLKTYNKKNDDLDVEIEIKSLPSFLKSAKSCDTNCVDMLWTPNDMILKNSDIWDNIKLYRDSIISKSMTGLIGYIKTHTHKYSNKIQRYQEMTELLSVLKYIHDDAKLDSINLPEILEINDFKYIKLVTQVSDHEQTYLEVCGKKYILSWECKLLKNALQTELKRYGGRTKDGDKKGLDCKSLSHALRVLYQLEELILNKNITFPLKDSEYIKSVKVGEITDEVSVINKIDSLFDKVNKLLGDSDLPETSNIDKMMDVLEGLYTSRNNL